MTKVGRLTLLDDLNQDGRCYVLVLCDCSVKKAMRKDYIDKCKKSGIEASCGCRQKEVVQQLGFKNRKYDYNRKKLYDCWKNMIDRCTNRSSHNWKDYGGRGITVCIQWQGNIEQFISDVDIPPKDNYELDRIDSNGNYEPGNVRWVSRTDNVRNRRNTKMLTVDGETKPMATWCEIYGISYDIVKQRIRRLGWDVKRALTEPSWLGKNQVRIA